MDTYGDHAASRILRSYARVVSRWASLQRLDRACPPRPEVEQRKAAQAAKRGAATKSCPPATLPLLHVQKIMCFVFLFIALPRGF